MSPITTTPSDQNKQRPSRLTLGLLAALLILSFFLRAYHPLSRSPLWPQRAAIFLEAVRTQDWAGTYQSRHPGVTVMALGALTYAAYDLVEDTPLAGLLTWGALPYVNSLGRDVAVGMIGMALLLTLLLLMIALCVQKLGGWTLALVTTTLLSISPFYLAQSRVFHLDALVSTLMILSALLIILHLEHGGWPYLIGSALVGGFAFLTKSPAVFLVPFTGLCLLTYAAVDARASWADHSAGRGGWLLDFTARRLILPLSVWLVIAALMLFVWPSTWQPEVNQPMQKVLFGAFEHVENAHPSPRFFAGSIYLDKRLPITYYPLALIYRTTFITLAFLVVSLLTFTRWAKRQLAPLKALPFWLMVAYVVFFTIQMTIAANQIDRYVLPAQAMLELIAAPGLIAFTALVKRAVEARSMPRANALIAAALVVPLMLHALVSLPLFPDFGAHFNYLLGSSPMASRLFSLRGQNEGTMYVADYLWSRDDAYYMKLKGSPTVWDQYGFGSADDPSITFEMTSVDKFLRGREDRDEFEARYAGQNPVMTVSFDGFTYVWLYRLDAPHDQSTIAVKRGWIGFVGVAWTSVCALIGTLVWTLRQQPDSDAQGSHT